MKLLRKPYNPNFVVKGDKRRARRVISRAIAVLRDAQCNTLQTYPRTIRVLRSNSTIKELTRRGIK